MILKTCLDDYQCSVPTFDFWCEERRSNNACTRH